jgi:hypothetical protein
VELVGNTDLGRSRDRRMERGRSERHKSGWGHAARWQGGVGEGGVCPASKGVERVESEWATQMGAARVGSVRPSECPIRSITDHKYVTYWIE